MDVSNIVACKYAHLKRGLCVTHLPVPYCPLLSLGQRCEPFFTHPPFYIQLCNPYRGQCPLEIVCEVSGLVDTGYTLGWVSTSKHRAYKATVQQYERIGGCYHLISTLQLFEPMVSQGLYWCIVSTADGALFLKSKPFTLLTPNQYRNMPACSCPTNESMSIGNDYRKHTREEVRKGLDEMSGNGSSSSSKTETTVLLVIGVGGIVTFILCLVLALVCTYCSSRKHQGRIRTELGSTTVTG